MKHLSLLSVLLSSALLAGCSSAGSSPASQNDAVATAIPQGTADGADIVECIPATEAGYYQSDSYFWGGASITYIDFETKSQIFLCNSPNCEHNDENCPAFYPVNGKTQLSGVQVAGDTLLAIQIFPTEQSAPHIDRLDLDGGAGSTLASFSSNQQLAVNILGDYFTDGDFLYFVLSTIDPATTDTTCSIVKVSLSDGTVAELCEPMPASVQLSIVGAAGRRLVCRTATVENAYTVTDSYYTFDVDTAAWEELPYQTNDDFGIEVRNETVYVRDGTTETVTLRNLATGAEQSQSYRALRETVEKEIGSDFWVGVYPVPFFENLCGISFNGASADGIPHRQNYLLDMETGEATRIPFYRSFNQELIEPAAETPDGLLVNTDWLPTEVRGPNGENDEIYLPEWGIITRENYRSGKAEYRATFSLDFSWAA